MGEIRLEVGSFKCPSGKSPYSDPFHEIDWHCLMADKVISSGLRDLRFRVLLVPEDQLAEGARNRQLSLDL